MKKKSILCVDDEKVLLRNIKIQIETEFQDNYNVETAENGEEALNKAKFLLENDIEIPVVIADLQMPLMKGDEFLIKFHKLSPNTSKILLTGLADINAIGNAINYAKLFGYMTKPWQIEDLLQKIREAIKSYNQKNKLSLVLSLIQHTSTILNISELLENILRNTIEITNAERGYLFIFNEKTKKLNINSQFNSGYMKDLSDVSICFVERVFNTSDELIITEEERDYNLFIDKEIQYEYINNCGLNSILCVPLKHRYKTIGVIYLDNPMSNNFFAKEDAELLKIFISQVSITIENTSLYNHQLQLMKAYKNFMPNEYLKFLEKQSIMDIKLGDQVEKEMTILFSDIRSFTELAERMTPKENFDFINAFLKQIGPIIRKNKGFIDKYIGDAVMAIFSDSPEDAVESAILMQKQMMAYNQTRKTNEPPINIGIGIHTGKLMLGIVGEEERMEGTVISDAVNLTSRLEGLTKEYGSNIIISEEVMEKIKNNKNFKFRFLDTIQVKGKIIPVSIYEVLNGESEEIMELKLRLQKEYESGWNLFCEGRINEAIDIFKQILKINPQDKASELHLKRCSEFL